MKLELVALDFSTPGPRGHLALCADILVFFSQLEKGVLVASSGRAQGCR